MLLSIIQCVFAGLTFLPCFYRFFSFSVSGQQSFKMVPHYILTLFLASYLSSTNFCLFWIYLYVVVNVFLMTIEFVIYKINEKLVLIVYWNTVRESTGTLKNGKLNMKTCRSTFMLLLSIHLPLLAALISCLPCYTAEYLGNSGGEQSVDQVSGGCSVLLCLGWKRQNGQCSTESEQSARRLNLPAAAGNPRWGNLSNTKIHNKKFQKVRGLQGGQGQATTSRTVDQRWSFKMSSFV